MCVCVCVCAAVDQYPVLILIKKVTLCDLYKKRYCSFSVRYGVTF